MAKENFPKSLVFGGAVVLLMAAAALSNSVDGPDRERSRGNYDYTERDPSDAPERISHDLTDFTSIRIEGAIELSVKPGEFDVEVASDRGYGDDVKVWVEDGVLVIDMDEKELDWDDADVFVRIAMPAFEGLDVRGAIDGRVRGFESETVDIDIRGAGNVELDGSCTTLTVDIRGAGNVEAEDFKCGDVSVNVRGAGNAEVWASESVDARLAGVGNIDVYGKPKDVNQRMGGIGTIDIH